ncbi:ubiquinol-cytochrome C reductase, partial [Serendipita vermifera]
LARSFYNTIARRNSIFFPTIMAGAFAFGVSFNAATDAFWDHWNRGKQWKDIRHKYIEQDE